MPGANNATELPRFNRTSTVRTPILPERSYSPPYGGRLTLLVIGCSLLFILPPLEEQPCVTVLNKPSDLESTIIFRILSPEARGVRDTMLGVGAIPRKYQTLPSLDTSYF